MHDGYPDRHAGPPQRPATRKTPARREPGPPDRVARWAVVMAVVAMLAAAISGADDADGAVGSPDGNEARSAIHR